VDWRPGAPRLPDMNNGAIIIRLFCLAEACFAMTAMVLCIAEFIIHRPIRTPIPSVYWPAASLGLHGSRKVRRIFRRLIGKAYRKHFWNPAVNSLLKHRGFDRQRHLSTSNIHAACSAMVLTLVAFFIYNHLYVGALLLLCFELTFNTPAIILSRYLFLLTYCRKMSRARGAAPGPNAASP